MDRVQQRRDPDHREAGDLVSRRPMAGAETTSVVPEMHPESQYLYRTAYTLLTAKNPLKMTHHGAEEHGDSGQRGTDEPSEDDRVALRLVGRHGPVVRQLPPELRGPLLGSSPRPVDRLRPARPRTPRRPDRQGFRVRGPGGTPRRAGGGQGRPRLRDAQGRRPRGPGSEEGADPGAEARQGAGRVTRRPLTFPFLFFVPRFST